MAGRGAVPHPPDGGLWESLGVLIAPILGAQKLLVPPCTTKYCGPHSQAQLLVVVPLLVYTPPRCGALSHQTQTQSTLL